MNHDSLRIDYEGDKVTITHLPSGKQEVAEDSSRPAIEAAIRRLSRRVPYYGDPGDESDHERWEGEGGAWL